MLFFKLYAKMAYDSEIPILIIWSIETWGHSSEVQLQSLTINLNKCLKKFGNERTGIFEKRL